MSQINWHLRRKCWKRNRSRRNANNCPTWCIYKLSWQGLNCSEPQRVKRNVKEGGFGKQTSPSPRLHFSTLVTFRGALKLLFALLGLGSSRIHLGVRLCVCDCFPTYTCIHDYVHPLSPSVLDKQAAAPRLPGVETRRWDHRGWKYCWYREVRKVEVFIPSPIVNFVCFCLLFIYILSIFSFQ